MGGIGGCGSKDGGLGICRGLIRCNGSRVHGLERQSPAAPGFQAPQKRAHTRDAVAKQEKRRPGAAGFVGSRAVQHDIAVTRNLLVAARDLLGNHVDSPWNPDLFGPKFELVPQIDDHRILSRC